MSRNKVSYNSFNYCGKNICNLRKAQKPPYSQRVLAVKMQLENIDIDKNAIQRIEAGQRSVSDVELVAFSNIFQISLDDLVKRD